MKKVVSNVHGNTSRNPDHKTMGLQKVVATVGNDNQRSNDYLRIKRANNNVMASMLQQAG